MPSRERAFDGMSALLIQTSESDGARAGPGLATMHLPLPFPARDLARAARACGWLPRSTQVTTAGELTLTRLHAPCESESTPAECPVLFSDVLVGVFVRALRLNNKGNKVIKVDRLIHTDADRLRLTSVI